MGVKVRVTSSDRKPLLWSRIGSSGRLVRINLNVTNKWLSPNPYLKFRSGRKEDVAGMYAQSAGKPTGTRTNAPGSVFRSENMS
jgi:hypothetical protein